MSSFNYYLAASTGELTVSTGDLEFDEEEDNLDYVQCSGNKCSAKTCTTMLKIDNRYEYHNMCNECFDELETYVEKINNERDATFTGVYCHQYESEEFEISH